MPSFLRGHKEDLLLKLLIWLICLVCEETARASSRVLVQAAPLVVGVVDGLHLFKWRHPFVDGRRLLASERRFSLWLLAARRSGIVPLEAVGFFVMLKVVLLELFGGWQYDARMGSWLKLLLLRAGEIGREGVVGDGRRLGKLYCLWLVRPVDGRSPR